MPICCNGKKKKILRMSNKLDGVCIITKKSKVSTICKCLPPGHDDKDELIIDRVVVVNVSLMKRWRAQRLSIYIL